MFLFKDSWIGQEPTLFICKEKDNKNAKAITLIVRPPTTKGVTRNFYTGGPIRSIDIKNINHKSIEYEISILIYLKH